jgi:hypothetical protein
MCTVKVKLSKEGYVDNQTLTRAWGENRGAKESNAFLHDVFSVTQKRTLEIEAAALINQNLCDAEALYVKLETTGNQ